MPSKTQEVHERITTQVVAAIAAGNVAPWDVPWATRWPVSLSTGRQYRGGNVAILVVTAFLKDYGSNFWGTYRQISALGGQVRKGEKATTVVLYKPIRVPDKDNPGKTKVIRFPQAFSVFNADQADGTKLPAVVAMNSDSPIEAAEEIIEGYLSRNPTLTVNRRSLNGAWYRPTTDTVGVPALADLESAEEFYSSLFHELGHSTGHPTRLNRDFGGVVEFGSERYSKEELVAEFTSAFLAGTVGIDKVTLPRSTSYLAGWASKLKAEPGLFLSAAAAAQKAVHLITDTAYESSDADEETPQAESESAKKVRQLASA